MKNLPSNEDIRLTKSLQRVRIESGARYLGIDRQHIVYTDGSYLKHPKGAGGWAAHIRDNHGNTRVLTGSERRTSINRMELMAVVAALQAINKPSNILVFTDSKFLCYSMDLIPIWKRNHWHTKKGKEVSNVDLWEKLHRLCAYHAVEWHHVQAHKGNALNEMVDSLALKAAKAI